MQLKILIFFLLIIFAIQSSGQALVPHPLKNSIHIPGDFSIINKQNLFDSTEIKKRNIQNAFLVKTYGDRDVDGNATHQDTLIVYYFDKTGKPFKEIHIEKSIEPPYTDPPQRRQSTFNLRNNDLEKGDIIKITKTKMDSTVVHITFTILETGATDTFHVFKSVYNKTGLLIEAQMTSGENFIKQIGCSTGSSYHYKYAYDNQRRLTFFESVSNDQYYKISYPFYGKLPSCAAFHCYQLCRISLHPPFYPAVPYFIASPILPQLCRISLHPTRFDGYSSVVF